MPRVLRIINRFNLGGPTYNAAYLTKYMSGYNTMLVGGVKDATEDSSEFILENMGITPVTIEEMKRRISPIDDFHAYKKIRSIIADFKPDIVHTHASKPGALGRLAAHHMKVPVILHTFHGHVFHSYFSKGTTLFYKHMERRLANISTRIIAISERQREELSAEHKICSADKIAIVPLGFDLLRFQVGIEERRLRMRSHYKISDNDVVVAIIGRLVPIKNHRLFLESIQRVKESATFPVKAFVVGDGELRNNLEAICNELGLSYSSDANVVVDVHFTSWVKDVETITAGADIIALTSLNEGTPVSLIEAQASNKPIVSTEVGGIENVVLRNETALLSEPDNVERFAENLLKLINNPGMRAQFGQRGWSFVESKFHYQRLVDDMARLYDSLLV